MWLFIITTFSTLILTIPAYSLTVEEAVRIALARNPDLQALRLEEVTANGQLEKALLFFSNNPTVEGNISAKDRPEEEGAVNLPTMDSSFPRSSRLPGNGIQELT